MAHGELAWLFIEPHTGLDHCPRILLSYLRARISGDLHVAVDEVVDLKVLVVIAKRVEQGLCNLDPAAVADELQDGEDGDVEVRGVLIERGACGHLRLDVEDFNC